MRSNYKRIGDCIRQIKVKNTKEKYDLLLGINIDKYFMPSVANIVGTDLTRYKVVKKNQFACNRMHVGRDYRIPMALSNKENPFIVSPAYTVFEIIEECDLLPEYLMMWFSRAEFDRETWFHTDADVRGGLPWDLFCDIELPIPSIEKQQDIVNEYNTITSRIALNEQLNQKLEETAQVLYKHWFVDFEFPNKEGKPYKSSGGKMVYNEDLGKEIPEGWKVQQLNELVDSQYGFTASADFEKKGVKFLRITDIASSYIDWDTVPYCEIKDKDLEKYKLYKGDIIVARTGASVGSAKQINKTNIDAVFASYLVRLKPKSNNLFMYLGLLVTGDLYRDYILNVAGGSAQPQANAVLMTNYNIILPNNNSLNFFNTIVEPWIDKKEILQNENSKLIELKNLLLSKMTKVEIEEEIV